MDAIRSYKCQWQYPTANNVCRPLEPGDSSWTLAGACFNLWSKGPPAVHSAGMSQHSHTFEAATCRIAAPCSRTWVAGAWAPVIGFASTTSHFLFWCWSIVAMCVFACLQGCQSSDHDRESKWVSNLTSSHVQWNVQNMVIMARQYWWFPTKRNQICGSFGALILSHGHMSNQPSTISEICTTPWQIWSFHLLPGWASSTVFCFFCLVIKRHIGQQCGREQHGATRFCCKDSTPAMPDVAGGRFLLGGACGWGWLDQGGLCWPILGLCWPILKAMWAHLRAMLVHLGAMLAQLGAMLAYLGAMLAHLGGILAHLGGYVGPSWGYVCPSWGSWATSWAQNTVKRGSFWGVFGEGRSTAAGAAAPISYGEERTAVRQCHGHGAPGRIHLHRTGDPPAGFPRAQARQRPWPRPTSR